MAIEVYVKNVGPICLGLACEGEDVFAANFGPDERNVLKGLLTSLPINSEFRQSTKPSAFALQVFNVLNDIYDGKETEPKLRLNMKHLPSYTAKVLSSVYLIPQGYVSPYGAVAKAVGGGPRAVGNAMARNPFAPLVPCHRVIAYDFTLGGYGGGFGDNLKTKLEFLKRERRGYKSEREIPMKVGRMHVYPVEYVLDRAEKARKK